MSYSIKYDTSPSMKHYEKNVVTTKRKKVLIASGVIGAAILIALYIAPIRRLLLPGDPMITERAIVKAVDELQAGEGLGEAITTFCREVIESDLRNEAT